MTNLQIILIGAWSVAILATFSKQVTGLGMVVAWFIALILSVNAL